jgi:potassium efflux system protein
VASAGLPVDFGRISQDHPALPKLRALLEVKVVSLSMNFPRFLLFLILAGSMGAFGGLPGMLARAHAQAPPPETDIATSPPAQTGSQAPQPIAVGEVPKRAEATRAELASLVPPEASRRTRERTEAKLDRALAETEASLARARRALAGRPNLRTLQRLQAELRGVSKLLQPLEGELDGRLARRQTSIQRLDRIEAAWNKTADVARRESPGATVVNRIAAVRGEIDQARSAAREQGRRTLALRDRLVDPGGAIVISRDQVQAAIEARFTGIFQVGQPPLWSLEVRESIAEEWKVGRSHFPKQFREVWEDPRGRLPILGFQFALFVALALGLRSLRGRARSRTDQHYDLRDAQQVFERPLATALIIVLMTPVQPMGHLGPVAAALLAAAVWSIARRFLARAMAPLAWGIALLYVVNQWGGHLDAIPTFERVAFVLQIIGALGLLLWLLRPSRLADIPPELRQAPFLRVVGAAMRLAVGVLALAIVADLFGWSDLAGLLGGGAMQGGYLGAFVFVLLKVARSLTAFALVLWPLRLLRSISKHRPLVRRRLDRLLTVAAVFLWAALFLGQLDLRGYATAGIGLALSAGVSVGTLSITLGGVLAFVLTVWLSYLLARFLDFLLQEDVFTRVETARGVPYAVAGLMRYTLILLGILAGLAAAGVELTKLTIIAGGLGVGIGFGLQNVVSNFVSGLILLFERPIQVGDTVQLSDLWGNMKRIGIRASVIHTFDGADVILPNSTLVSERLTNWTLSDQRRCITLDVGVRYGTPARKVIDLLEGVATANPTVIGEPLPKAYFWNFGDSALEFKLRVWFESFGSSFAVRSDLAVAIQDALEQADISVPFPQRDLHVVSVSPSAPSELDPEPSPPARPVTGSGDGS